MIRAEKIFQDCKDYLFTNFWPKVQSLQASIGDGIVLDDFAEKVTHGLNVFSRETYPILILEPHGPELDPQQGPTAILQKADLLVVVKGQMEDGDITTIKVQRYADALINLVEDDIIFGGAVTLVSIDRIAFGLGREGEQTFQMMLATLTFRK